MNRRLIPTTLFLTLLLSGSAFADVMSGKVVHRRMGVPGEAWTLVLETQEGSTTKTWVIRTPNSPGLLRQLKTLPRVLRDRPAKLEAYPSEDDGLVAEIEVDRIQYFFYDKRTGDVLEVSEIFD